MDWWETVSSDMMPLPERPRNPRSPTPLGYVGTLRMNQLIPPFDNPAIRRVLLQIVDQTDYMHRRRR